MARVKPGAIEAGAARAPLLTRLGLDRPELRAWALYDFANSAAVTTVITAVYPIYYGSVAGRGLAASDVTKSYAVATTVALVLVAILSPIVGAFADVRPWKKPLLAGFALLGAAGTAALWFVRAGDWRLGSALLVVLTIGLNGSFVVYDALLPHVAREEELDRVSSAGYALGYLGGGVLLAAQLVVILRPSLVGIDPAAGEGSATLPARIAFLSTAVWWVLFTVPLLRRVPEPVVDAAAVSGAALANAARRLRGSFRTLRAYPQALLMLAAFLVYNDGIGTVIRMATIYGTEIGLPQASLIAAILLVQFIGIPCAVLFAGVAGRVGTRPAILAGLAVYTAVAVLGYYTRTAAHFFTLAVLVGMVQGGTQALSRSLFASLVPKQLSGEFFGLFAVSEKVAGILGPGIFAAAIALTGSSRSAILSVIAFFAVGALLLWRVDVDAGRRAAEVGTQRPH